MTNSVNIGRRDLLAAATVTAAATIIGSEPVAAQAPAGRMTIHVLDLFAGVPADGVKVDLFAKQGNDMKLVKTVMTGVSGRPDSGPLLAGDAFTVGRYMVAFELSDYFKKMDKTLPANFFRKVTMEFEVVDAKMPHHIPMQCTPWTQACSVLPG